MKPVFQILADDEDVTATIRDRFISLTLGDERGMSSDSLTLVLDDRDGRLAIPRKGARLRVRIGWQGRNLVDRGVYTVDGVTLSGPPDQMVIKANAADLRDSMRSPKDRTWDQVTLGDLVRTVAGDHDMEAKIAADLDGVALGHVDQTAESDLHLLTRLAAQHGAIAKPANGYLLFVPRGEAKSASGKQLPVVTIHRNQTSRHTFTEGDRSRYESVTAQWHDALTGAALTETFGAGEPVYQLRGSFGSAAEALAAAEAKYRELQFKGARLSLAVSDMDVGLFAEGPIVAAGFRDGINGDWVADSVVIELSERGLAGRVEAVVGR